ncbi:unnamed protein product [Peronospora belbahrii]|uniref:Uncharacterized protein n=1 Tax=Peronospora belbahrii TaxID=622444 RepID=A0ABN8CQ07_9STRA|nr:unnamed protein product [Peronospora belbahrii]CAH0514309.1 unnamed protein product [Peronospora belbahrii]
MLFNYSRLIKKTAVQDTPEKIALTSLTQHAVNRALKAVSTTIDNTKRYLQTHLSTLEVNTDALVLWMSFYGHYQTTVKVILLDHNTLSNKTAPSVKGTQS